MGTRKYVLTVVETLLVRLKHPTQDIFRHSLTGMRFGKPAGEMRFVLLIGEHGVFFRRGYATKAMPS